MQLRVPLIVSGGLGSNWGMLLIHIKSAWLISC